MKNYLSRSFAAGAAMLVGGCSSTLPFTSTTVTAGGDQFRFLALSTPLYSDGAVKQTATPDKPTQTVYRPADAALHP